MTDSLTRELLAVRERAQERRTQPRRSSRERDIRELVHVLYGLIQEQESEAAE